MAGMTAFIPLAMQVAGTLFSASASNDSAGASREIAQRKKSAAYFTADQLESASGQQLAAAQRAARERQREATLVQSRALAVAAAGGGGVSDPTIVNLMGKVAGEGAYRASVALYEGNERARNLRMKAEAARYEGDMALEAGELQAKAYKTQGTSALLKGLPGIFQSGKSLFDKYGGGGPGAASGDSALVGGFGEGFGSASVG